MAYSEAWVRHHRLHIHVPAKAPSGPGRLSHSRGCKGICEKHLSRTGTFDSQGLIRCMSSIAIRPEREPFSMESASHGRDLLLGGCWCVMRELEVASYKWAHINFKGSSVNLLLPVQKNDTAGSLTIRTLRCACRVRVHPLCRVHAARRHINRVRAHRCLKEQSEFPLVPTIEGKTPSKHMMVQFFRRTIAATGTPTTRRANQIQLLGRWSSAAVEKYLQLASV